MGEDALRQFLPLLLLTGCVTAQPASSALTVSEVWARHHELEGKEIRVQGVVTDCYSLGCHLQETDDRDSKWLGIGGSGYFDDVVAPYLGKRIIVAGRLRGDCLHTFADAQSDSGEMVVCTDRASMIMEPRLVGVGK